MWVLACRFLLYLGPGRTRANFVYFQFLASKKLAKISQVPNFGGAGRIGRTCFNQNVPDRHVRHKIYRVKLFVDFSLRCMFLTLRSPATRDFRPLNWTSSFRSACWRFCCCLHHLRSKKIVLLRPSLQVVASNQINETSHKNLNKNAARVPRFHQEKRQMDRLRNDYPAIARPKLHQPSKVIHLAVILSTHVWKNMTV